MKNDISYKLSFYKTNGEELTFDDHAEIVEEALLMLGGIVFFITTYTDDYFEGANAGRYDLHLEGMRGITDELIGVVQENAEKVNNQRKKLEKIVSTPSNLR